MFTELLSDQRVGRIMGAAVVCVMLVLLSPAHAASLAEVTFPDDATVGDKAVVLNGLGIRTATMLKVKVYVIALYLESKNSDAAAIIQDTGNKRIAMHFLHKVTADELRGGWSEGFKDNTKDVASIKNETDQFNASMRDVKVGDVIVVDFVGENVDVLINDAKIDSVTGAAFQRALLAIWLGAKPPNDALKEGILGGTGD
jgi:hypothetical protein